MANRLAEETSPYLLQHKDNPVDWYPWGEEALRTGAGGGQADPGFDRLLRLPLVPRDGARVVRGPADGGLHERALRPDQGRPRGAARRRRDLHAGGAGDDRPGRLAADRLPRPRAASRSSAAPTSRPRAATACRASARCWRRSPRPGATRRDEIESAAPSTVRGLEAATRLRPSDEMLSPERARRGRARRCAQQFDPVNGGFGGAPKFPPASALEFLMRRWRRGAIDARARRWSSDAGADGAGRHVRPGRRRLRALLGRRALARPPLREDALRQRAAGTRLPARLAADRGASCSGASATETLDWALREMRAPRGRLLLGARRRLGGRGGQVLRLDVGRAARAARRRRRAPDPLLGPRRRAATSRARNILHVR